MNGFYKYIKIYCFFLKHFITLLNIPFFFPFHHWQSTVVICSLMPFPENIDLWPWLCMGRVLGMCLIYFLTLCLFLSPVLFSVFNLWPEEKQSTQTIKNLFWKGCLKWHRTQGLMINLSKPGINATTEVFGTAEALKKAVAPDCYPSGSLGVDMSPGHSSEVPHYVSCALQVRVGTEIQNPAVAQRSVEINSGLCLPFSEQECSFNHL